MQKVKDILTKFFADNPTKFLVNDINITKILATWKVWNILLTLSSKKKKSKLLAVKESISLYSYTLKLLNSEKYIAWNAFIIEERLK